MSLSSIQKKMIEEKLKTLHVAFLAKILLLNDAKTKAKIQPLGLVKAYGGTPQKQSVITNVHIAESARNKLSSREIVDGNNDKQMVAVLTPISVGDVVICVCCDRNIDAALKGENSLPPVGYHNKSDCVIVAII